MRNFILALLVAGVAMATPAFAQDEPNPVSTGPRVGAIIGYDLAVGGLLIGAEGEATEPTAKSDNTAYTTTTFGDGRVRQLRDLNVGGRIGVLASPTTMIYAKGGYTNAQLRVLAGLTNMPTTARFDLDGHRIGAGVEHAVGANSYAKIEYRYSTYGRADVLYGSGATSGRLDVDTDRHQVVAPCGFRF